MNYSSPYRQQASRQLHRFKKKLSWDFKQALGIGGTFAGFGMAQLLLILIIDLPKHDCRVPFVRMALALFFFTLFALCGICRKVIKEYYLE